MSQAPNTQKSDNLLNVEKYQASNDTLKEKLDLLQSRLTTKNLDTLSRAETDQIFKKIAYRKNSLSTKLKR